MIERAIEHWLIRTNERNYKTAFVQSLSAQGYRVLTVPADGPMEQGKDLITIDPSGRPCGFQLKTGDLDLASWRKYREEMMELIQLPIYHPSIDRQVLHRAVLVTNGEMTNEVRIQIDQINQDNLDKKRGYAHLEVLTRRPLLQQFIEAQGIFIPRELSEFRAFLEVFQSDGTDFLPIEKFVGLVDGTLLVGATRPSDIRSAIASTLIFTSYALSSFQEQANHFALFQGWVSLAASLVRFALKHQLKRELWKPSLDLALAEVTRHLVALRAEVLSRPNYLEGSAVGDGGSMHSTRALLCLGASAAVTTHFSRLGLEDPDATRLVQRIDQDAAALRYLWGESAFPFYFHVIKLLETKQNLTASAEMLRQLLETLLQKDRDAVAPPNLYFDAHECLGIGYSLLTGVRLTDSDDEINLRQFSGESMAVESIIEMLTRRGDRAAVAAAWPSSSKLLYRDFRPDQVEDAFAWRSDAGKDSVRWPPRTQSWAALQETATDQSGIPSAYREFAELLWFLILVYPHRCTPQIMRVLDALPNATANEAAS